MKTFWISFADPDSGKNLGISIIDVDDIQATKERNIMKTTHPNALPGAEWLGAALRAAWRAGCNPGGAAKAMELPADTAARQLPRETLFQKDDPRLKAVLEAWQ